MTDSIDGLEDFFDGDLSLALLNISIHKGVNAKDVVAKSVYNFDLDSPEGVERLIAILPIMDPDIINEVYQEIFPGYPVQTLSPRIARAELRGYFMDFLATDGQEKPETIEQPEPDASAEGDEAGQAEETAGAV